MFYPLVGPETPATTSSTDTVETAAESAQTTSDTQPTSGKVKIYTYTVYVNNILQANV